LNHPDANLKSTEALIDKAISLFDDLIEKIHAAKRKLGKEGFKPLRADLVKSIDGLQKELVELG
jgi:hypothetical protein